MTAVQTKKYVVIGDDNFKASNAWLDECRKAEIPYIRVEHFGVEEGKSSVSWDLEILPSDLLSIFIDAQAQLFSCIRTIMNLLLPDALIAEYSNAGGEVYFLEKENAERIAEVLGTFLFVMTDFARLNLPKTEVEKTF